MSDVKPFVGHDYSWNHLISEMNARTLPAAYLFYGPPGIGKALVARAFAARLLCHAPKGDFACGQCESCHKSQSNRHPDLLIVNPADNRKTISVDQCRDVIENLALAPLEGHHKIVLFPDTALLGVSGWNALLKSIEEPQPGRLFILAATSLSRVLPTIRSRCRRVAFLPPQTEESLKYLIQVCGGMHEADEISKALHLSSGSIGLARKILEGGITPYLNEMKSVRGYKEVQSLVEKITKSSVDLSLLLQVYLRSLTDECLESPSEEGVARLDRVNFALRDVERHVNKTFVLENLFL